MQLPIRMRQQGDDIVAVTAEPVTIEGFAPWGFAARFNPEWNGWEIIELRSGVVISPYRLPSRAAAVRHVHSLLWDMGSEEFGRRVDAFVHQFGGDTNSVRVIEAARNPGALCEAFLRASLRFGDLLPDQPDAWL